jgi:hypothetical protein
LIAVCGEMAEWSNAADSKGSALAAQISLRSAT